MSVDLAGHRVEEYWAQLLDGDDNLVRDLEEFQGGTYEESRFATIRGGGSIDCVFETVADYLEVDWGSARIMLWYTPAANLPDKEVTGWPLGVFLVEAPTAEHDDENGTVRVTIKIMDKLAVPAQDDIDASFSLPAGTNVVDAVVDLLVGMGETKIAATGSSETLTAGLVWEADTTKLKVINDLLAMINYTPLWVDGYGTYRVEPYVSDDQRSPAYRFETGEASIHAPRWSRTHDWFDVPNRYKLVSSGDEDTEAMVATVTNQDGNDNLPVEYSVAARGRVIARTETGVEATSQAVLEERAMRAIRSASYRVVNLEVEHAMTPTRTGDVIEFITPAYEGRATISKYSVSLVAGSLVSGTWRQIDAGSIALGDQEGGGSGGW